MKSTGQSSHGWHRVASFMRCPQEYTYGYLFGLRAKTAGKAPSLGTAVHALLATYYSRDPEHMEELKKFDAGTVNKAKDIMRRYIVDPPHAIEPEQVLTVEQEYEVYLGKHRFTRRLDLVFTDGTSIYVMDHKTAADIMLRQKTARHDLALATQIVVASRFWGFKFKQFWLNLISTTEPRQLCIPLQFSTGFLDNVILTLDHYLKQIEDFRADMFKAPRTWQCKVGCHTCNYWSLCTYGPSALVDYEIDDAFQLTVDVSL